MYVVLIIGISHLIRCIPKGFTFVKYIIVNYIGFLIYVSLIYKELESFFGGGYCLFFLLFSTFFPLAALCSMQDLSSLTRDQTHTLCNGSASLNHWTTREVSFPTPPNFFNWSIVDLQYHVSFRCRAQRFAICICVYTHIHTDTLLCIYTISDSFPW